MTIYHELIKFFWYNRAHQANRVHMQQSRYANAFYAFTFLRSYLFIRFKIKKNQRECAIIAGFPNAYIFTFIKIIL